MNESSRWITYFSGKEFEPDDLQEDFDELVRRFIVDEITTEKAWKSLVNLLFEPRQDEIDLENQKISEFISRLVQSLVNQLDQSEWIRVDKYRWLFGYFIAKVGFSRKTQSLLFHLLNTYINPEEQDIAFSEQSLIHRNICFTLMLLLESKVILPTLTRVTRAQLLNYFCWLIEKQIINAHKDLLCNQTVDYAVACLEELGEEYGILDRKLIQTVTMALSKFVMDNYENVSSCILPSTTEHHFDPTDPFAHLSKIILSPDGFTARNCWTDPRLIHCQYLLTRGVYYVEVTIQTSGQVQLGWLAQEKELQFVLDGYNSLAFYYQLDRAKAHHCACYLMDKTENTSAVPMPKWVAGDVIGCWFDIDGQYAQFYHNGIPIYLSYSLPIQSPIVLVATLFPQQQCHFNLGQTDFRYAHQLANPDQLKYTTIHTESQGDSNKYQLCVDCSSDSYQHLVQFYDPKLPIKKEICFPWVSTAKPVQFLAVSNLCNPDNDPKNENEEEEIFYSLNYYCVNEKPEKESYNLFDFISTRPSLRRHSRMYQAILHFDGEVNLYELDQEMSKLITTTSTQIQPDFSLIDSYIKLLHKFIEAQNFTRLRNTCLSMALWKDHLHFDSLRTAQALSKHIIDILTKCEHIEVVYYVTMCIETLFGSCESKAIVNQLLDALVDIAECRKRQATLLGSVPTRPIKPTEKEFSSKHSGIFCKLNPMCTMENNHQQTSEHFYSNWHLHYLAKVDIRLADRRYVMHRHRLQASLEKQSPSRRTTNPECRLVRSKYPVRNGQVYYYEAVLLSNGPMRFGWTGSASKEVKLGDDHLSIGLDLYSGGIWYDRKLWEIEEKLHWKAGDVVACAIDVKNWKFDFYLNGQKIKSAQMFNTNKNASDFKSGSNLVFFAAVTLHWYQQCYFNFGQTNFKYVPVSKFANFHASSGGQLTRYELIKSDNEPEVQPNTEYLQSSHNPSHINRYVQTILQKLSKTNLFSISFDARKIIKSDQAVIQLYHSVIGQCSEEVEIPLEKLDCLINAISVRGIWNVATLESFVIDDLMKHFENGTWVQQRNVILVLWSLCLSNCFYWSLFAEMKHFLRHLLTSEEMPCILVAILLYTEFARSQVAREQIANLEIKQELTTLARKYFDQLNYTSTQELLTTHVGFCARVLLHRIGSPLEQKRKLWTISRGLFEFSSDGYWIRCYAIEYRKSANAATLRCKLATCPNATAPYFYEVRLFSSFSFKLGWSVQVKPGYECPFPEEILFDLNNQLVICRNTSGTTRRKFALANFYSWTAGDVIGCWLDAPQHQLRFYHNGQHMMVVNFNANHLMADQSYQPTIEMQPNQMCCVNLGQSHFWYPPSDDTHYNTLFSLNQKPEASEMSSSESELDQEISSSSESDEDMSFHFGSDESD